jgi:hypothetical protein
MNTFVQREGEGKMPTVVESRNAGLKNGKQRSSVFQSERFALDALALRSILADRYSQSEA